MGLPLMPSWLCIADAQEDTILYKADKACDKMEVIKMFITEDMPVKQDSTY